MPKAKTPKPKSPDKEQSKRFVEAARKLEADGELNLIDADDRFKRAFEKIVGPRRKRLTG